MKKNKLNYRVEWEKINGPIPVGYVIHHINEDYRDDRLENLCLMTRAEHTRHHLKKS